MMNKLLSYTLILHRPPTLIERFLHKMEAVKPLLHLVISCCCIELHQRSASYMATCVLHIWQVGALSLPRYGAHYGLWHTGWSTPAVMWSIWAIQLLLVQYFAPDTIKYIFSLIFCTRYNKISFSFIIFCTRYIQILLHKWINSRSCDTWLKDSGAHLKSIDTHIVAPNVISMEVADWRWCELHTVWCP